MRLFSILLTVVFLMLAGCLEESTSENLSGDNIQENVSNPNIDSPTANLPNDGFPDEDPDLHFEDEELVADANDPVNAPKGSEVADSNTPEESSEGEEASEDPKEEKSPKKNSKKFKVKVRNSVQRQAVGWNQLHKRIKISANLPNSKFECALKPQKIKKWKKVEYKPCDGVDGEKGRFDHTQYGDLEDGSYKLRIRAKANGQTSKPKTLSMYLHSSLNGVENCKLPVSKKKFLKSAQKILNGNKKFKKKSVRSSNPFIKIAFNNDEANKAEILSLRRKFTLSRDKKFLMIHRQYPSKTYGGCGNFFKIGNKGFGDQERLDCHVLAINAEGNGVCLQAEGKKVVSKRLVSNVWRTLGGNKRSPASHRKPFSQKTLNIDEASDDILYLPR